MGTKTKLNRLTITEVSVCDVGANQGSYMVIAKTKDSAPNPATSVVANTEDTDMPFDLTSIPEEFRKSVGDYVASLEVAHAEEIAKAKAAAPVTPVETPEPVVEVPTEVTKKLVEQSAEIAKLRAEMDKRDETDAIAKAKVELTAFDATEVETIAKGLFKLSRVDAPLAETVRKALNSAQAIAKKNVQLTTELGSSSRSTGGTAYEKAEALAKAMVDNKTAPTLADAFVKVYNENPSLYDEYVAEVD